MHSTGPKNEILNKIERKYKQVAHILHHILSLLPLNNFNKPNSLNESLYQHPASNQIKTVFNVRNKSMHMKTTMNLINKTPYLPLKRSTAWRSLLSYGLLGDWVPTCPVSPWGTDRRSLTWPWPTQMEKVHQHMSHFISTVDMIRFFSPQNAFKLLNLN